VRIDPMNRYGARGNKLSIWPPTSACRRLRRILARKREMEKWCEKWDAMHDRFVKEVDALQAIKPEGVY
jgi:hypothetical protein